jgi:hypothetical protein
VHIVDDHITEEVVLGTPAPAEVPSGPNLEIEGKKKKVRNAKGKLFLRSPGPRSVFGVGVKWRKEREGYRLETENDIVGIVMLEIQSVEDLPKLRNSGYFVPLSHV